MWIWFTIPVGLGIAAALIGVARHGGREGIYVGIVESRIATDTDRGGLQVRAYIDHGLVHELRTPSKPTSRMILRETSASVPLEFVRVPSYVLQKLERSGERQEWDDTSVLPVIFGFRPTPDLPVHPGQLVDVCIGTAFDCGPGETTYYVKSARRISLAMALDETGKAVKRVLRERFRPHPTRPVSE